MLWLEETGGDRDKLKEYFNVEFPPHVTADPNATGPTTVLSRCPIPLLHTIKLNPVNHILQYWAKEVKGAGGEKGWPGLEEWFKELHVVKDNYHGKKFEGNLKFYCTKNPI